MSLEHIFYARNLESAKKLSQENETSHRTGEKAFKGLLSRMDTIFLKHNRKKSLDFLNVLKSLTGTSPKKIYRWHTG